MRHPLYEKSLRPRDMYEGVRDIIPDTSFANVENRLQMLIMNTISQESEEKK